MVGKVTKKLVYSLKSLTILFLRFNRIKVVEEEIRNLKVSNNKAHVHYKTFSASK